MLFASLTRAMKRATEKVNTSAAIILVIVLIMFVVAVIAQLEHS
jgi:Kef-type K+ transport system membrane component KefB